MTRPLKVIIVATHPIQYQVPWFRLLSEQEGIDLKVCYALLPDERQQGTGFGVPFSWDIPMLEGYRWEVLQNSVKSPSLNRFWGSSTPGVFKVFSMEKPDVVIITGWQSLPLLQALWACKKLGIPRIIRGESNVLRTRPAWVKLIHRLFLSAFDAFLTIGTTNREFYISYGIPEGKMFNSNYFVDNRWFQLRIGEISLKRNSIRSEWEIEKKEVCFLYAGKLITKKRIFDLLAAMEIACRKAYNLRLLVVGTGELMESARQLAAKQQLPVNFAGFLNQTEIVKAYAAADCIVLPSDFGETWGLVVNEAMACGLPAIVSDRVGCGPDLVEDGVTGFVFPFGDVNALADRMLKMASDEDVRQRMGYNAQERIKEYSVEKAVEGTLNAINYVLKEG